jgi:tetratricopeptide (TPR) repeat protein
MIKKVFLSILLVFSFAITAQEKDALLPKANEEFAAKNYADAEANYRISHSKFPRRTVASYNLGNAIYRQNQFSESKIAFANALKTIRTYPQKHKALHNLGNVFMKEKNYSQAVEAYKNALRNNPEDEETRYNYALAKKMLKDNPPKDDKNKDKNKDKDKKDDKKDGENKDKNKDKGDQNKDKKENQGDKEKQDDPSKNQGQPKPNPGGISQQRVQNLLDAVNNEEKKVQNKVNAQKVKGKPVQTEKDW